ncbi:MAG: hypothetical protein IKX25_01430 [Bacteroidales bacterium]|nr:hypothetical protein [Bacteroidales bacterium]
MRLQPALGLAAASLEAGDDLTEVDGELSFHKEDAVHVVGHHLQGYHVYLGVESVDTEPLFLNGLAKFRKDDVRCVATTCLGEGIASQFAKEGKAAFGLQRNHIEAPFCVVMTTGSAFHRRLLFTCVFLLLGKLFLGHNRS